MLLWDAFVQVIAFTSSLLGNEGTFYGLPDMPPEVIANKFALPDSFALWPLEKTWHYCLANTCKTNYPHDRYIDAFYTCAGKCTEACEPECNVDCRKSQNDSPLQEFACPAQMYFENAVEHCVRIPDNFAPSTLRATLSENDGYLLSRACRQNCSVLENFLFHQLDEDSNPQNLTSSFDDIWTYDDETVICPAASYYLASKDKCVRVPPTSQILSSQHRANMTVFDGKLYAVPCRYDCIINLNYCEHWRSQDVLASNARIAMP